MSAEPDDEALSWDGQKDSTHVESTFADELPRDEAPDAAEPPASSALLVSYGAFGGVFLVYVVGWIIAIQAIPASSAGALPAVLDRVAQFLAFLSPVLWFFGVLMLTPKTRARTRMLWLALGVVILAPWPFILGY
jgi:hypothetical protein